MNGRQRQLLKLPQCFYGDSTNTGLRDCATSLYLVDIPAILVLSLEEGNLSKRGSFTLSGETS